MNKPIYEELQAQVKQLAAENAALKDFISTQCFVYDAKGHEGDAEEARPSTPATEAILASLRAEAKIQCLESLAGVAETMLIKFTNQLASSDMHDVVGWKMVLRQAESAAAQLRSKSEVQS